MIAFRQFSIGKVEIRNVVCTQIDNNIVKLCIIISNLPSLYSNFTKNGFDYLFSIILFSDCEEERKRSFSHLSL